MSDFKHAVKLAIPKGRIQNAAAPGKEKRGDSRGWGPEGAPEGSVTAAETALRGSV